MDQKTSRKTSRNYVSSWFLPLSCSLNWCFIRETISFSRNSTEVVLRNRRQQPRSSKRPSSWAGATSKSSFLEFQVDFQSDSNKTGTSICSSFLNSEFLGRCSFMRNGKWVNVTLRARFSLFKITPMQPAQPLDSIRGQRHLVIGCH